MGDCSTMKSKPQMHILPFTFLVLNSPEILTAMRFRRQVVALATAYSLYNSFQIGI